MSHSACITASLWRLRFTLVFLAVMFAANWVAGGIWRDLPAAALSRWGISHYDLADGDFYRVVTATFLSVRPRMFLDQAIFSLSVIGWYEWRDGSTKAAAMFFGINTLGFLLTLFGVVALVAGSAAWPDLATTHDVGMSAGGFGLVGALLATWPRRWVLLTITLLALGAKFWLWPDPIADIAHPITLVLGFALERYLLSVRPPRRPLTED